MANLSSCNEMSTNDQKKNDPEQFTVLINGESDLEKQLDEFKQACKTHEAYCRRVCRKRYYNVGLLAKIEPNSPIGEFKLLIKNGGRTFLFDRVTYKAQEMDHTLAAMNMAIDQEQDEDNSVQLVVGLALQITGDCCRIGRLHNNCSVFLQRGDITTLTNDIKYKYSCYKEIMYVINLEYYISVLKLGDEICIGKEVSGKIVKKLRNSIALLINDAGIINSFEFLKLPYECKLEPDVLIEMLRDDLEYASKINTDFIVMPHIRCMLFLKLLYQSIQERKLKLIGTIDLQFASRKMVDLIGIIRIMDVLWIPDLFTAPILIQNYICQEVIPIAKCLKKPIIGTVPIECCTDFKAYENHEYLWKIDCICIEKSPWCNKYPLIVKKLQPVKDYRMLYTDDTMTPKNTNSSYNSVVNFIIRTITSVECQCIFLSSRCEKSIRAFGCPEVYCPVYVVLPIEDMGTHGEKIENDQIGDESRVRLAKLLHMHRNLKPIIYTEEMNTCRYKPIEFGINIARKNDCIKTGDFLITVEVGLGLEESMEVGGSGEDVVIMRAFYLPPPKEEDKYQCFEV